MHEWSGRQEIFSRPQAIENSRQYLLLRTDILQKTVVGCPCLQSRSFNFKQNHFKNSEGFFRNDGYFHLINSFIHNWKKYLHLIVTLLVPLRLLFDGRISLAEPNDDDGQLNLLFLLISIKFSSCVWSTVFDPSVGCILLTSKRGKYMF